MPIIDNKTQTLRTALSNAMQHTDMVEVCVGYFYLSGFESLAEELRNKKVRILVGLEVDPSLIPDIVKLSSEEDCDFSRFQFRTPTKSTMRLKANYIDSLVGFINDSDTFDSIETEKALDLFLDKIENGTLEIRKTTSDFHGKFYILHNEQQYSQNGDYPGTVFSGSSNFTYKGLIGQGELNDSYREKSKFLEYEKIFTEKWNSESISIVDPNNKVDFLNELHHRVWKFALPTPYEMYLRVLHETFGKDKEAKIETPNKITSGLYLDLEYQLDAIKMGLDRLSRYDGVIIADVVGLGKSIIASAIARNLDDYTTLIITPPHLIGQWEDYHLQFRLRGPKIMSGGNIPAVFEKFQISANPLLIIIDEAHRFRNEDTNDYKMLHQICRSNPNNKVILLTATPFNNAPKDIFALVKLFQIPGRSTIRSVDNLSIRFRDLIDRYKKLRRVITQGTGKLDIDQETREIAFEQRRLIENVVIRRSRLDLKQISRYREDLERQNITFATVVGPTLLHYDLGELSDLYINTLEKLVGSGKNGLIGARYQPSQYGINSKMFKEHFGSSIEEADLKIAQINLATFMKRLLVMRFESSKYAFKSTLSKMIKTNQIVETWWNDLGGVPILKKGELPDPSEYTEEDGEFSADLDDEIRMLSEKKGLLIIPKEMLDRADDFIADLQHDTELLRSILDEWFGADSPYANIDPKADELFANIRDLIQKDPSRKIVVFSCYADTVNDVFNKIQSFKTIKVIKYTAADPKRIRGIVRDNFDASIKRDEQKNDFDVLIASDALSEGINLHRAGVIINYDIPYNPTRVIQRVGRINRINKKVFENLYVFNFFPTVIGEHETKIKQISTLKMNLINAIIGTDTKHLTQDETIQSFFKSEYDKAQEKEDELSWDAIHRDNYEKALKNKTLIQKIIALPRRSRILRYSSQNPQTIAFGKKGEESVFAISDGLSEPVLVGNDQAIPLFFASEDENSYEVGERFGELLKIVKDKLFMKHPVPSVKGRRLDAVRTLQAIKSLDSSAESYCIDLIKVIREFDDISEGTLKDISQIDLKKPEAIIQVLYALVPKKIVENILERAEKADCGRELLLLVEDLKHGTK